MNRVTVSHEDLVEFLQTPRAFPENGEHVEAVETHISWVFLTEHYAYKLKKPVRFDFLDFSTAEARRQACEAEVQLNRRLAEEIYLDVVPVREDARGRLHLKGEGQIVDWLVKMRRLPEELTLESLILQQRVASRHLWQLSERLIEFYRRLPPLPLRPEEYRDHLLHHVLDNRKALLAEEHGLDAALVRRVSSGQLRLLQMSPELFDSRVLDGRIVDGHGDLRPEHIYFNSSPVIIDCIEFNEEFRQIDVADELSFLAMECDKLGAGDVGPQLIAAYQKAAGDRPPASLWNFYKAYRACVRAKVAVLRRDQVPPAAGAELLREARAYLQLAEQYVSQLARPLLLVVCGLMGTGKSTLARELAEQLDGELIQTDQIRHELFPDRDENAAYGEGLYRPEKRQQVYETMLQRAAGLLCDGVSVVLDGTFMNDENRRKAVAIAAQYLADPWFVHCQCPPELAKQRISERQAGNTLSEARPELFDTQASQEDAFAESMPVLEVETTDSLPAMLHQIYTRLSRQLPS